MRTPLAAALVVLAFVACTGGSGHDLPPSGLGAKLDVSSPAFGPGDPIPVRFTCDGADAAPPVRWSGAAEGGTLVVLMTDSDAHDFVHWLVYDIPGGASGGVGGSDGGGIEGKNDFGRNGYGGPCPPHGDAPHHYVITVYEAPAGTASPFAPGESPDEVVPADPVAQGSVTGTYARR